MKIGRKVCNIPSKINYFTCWLLCYFFKTPYVFCIELHIFLFLFGREGGWGSKINFFEEKKIRNICVEKSMDPDQSPFCL